MARVLICRKLMIARSLTILLFVCPFLGAAQSSQEVPGELVRRVVQNELRAEEQDHSHWMFRLETEKKNAQTEVDEVIETKDGDLKRPLLFNGRELTPIEQQESDKRLEQLVQNPAVLRKSLKDENQDNARSQRLLKMLPDAFLFNYGEQRGDLVQLSFRPNPNFHPRNHEAQVFHAMQGVLWVDNKQNRLAEISGQLIDEVRFGGGLLGHLNKGGTFDVKQTMVSPGYWELTVLNVQMNGKALFFKTISVKEKYFRTEFKRVPDDLTVAEAAEMLRKEVAPQRTNRP